MINIIVFWKFNYPCFIIYKLISVRYFYISYLISQVSYLTKSEWVNKYENHTLILFKNTYCKTEILIKKEKYFSFPFIFMFLYIFVIMFYVVDTFFLSL